MSDWWSKKLAGERPTPPRPALPPTEVPIRFPQAPQHQQGQQRTARSDEGPEPETLSEFLRSNRTKGGEATRKENMTCPDCGSPYVFSRTGRGSGTTINGAAPAPRCYECGWNGLYDQANQGNWIR